MGILSLILLALTMSLSLRLGRHISMPLLELRVWLRDPDDPAPGSGRQDEIGDLARQLQQRLVPAKAISSAVPAYRDIDDGLDDEPLADFADDDPQYLDEEDEQPDDAFAVPDLRDPQFDDDDLADDFSKPSLSAAEDEDDPFAELRDAPSAPAAPAEPVARQASAVLSIQLGAQEQLRRLPRSRLMDLLQRYRTCLEQTAALYQGQLHTLSDGNSLMLFHQSSSGADYVTHAICSGELLRALGHALQIEVADSGITLQLQFGLTAGDDLSTASQGDLLLSDTAQDALALSQHSRNLLLVSRQIAEDALLRQRVRIRAIASPEGASCVERLLDPYPALLERQMARMHENKFQA
jgi:hypothetical protein